MKRALDSTDETDFNSRPAQLTLRLPLSVSPFHKNEENIVTPRMPRVQWNATFPDLRISSLSVNLFLAVIATSLVRRVPTS